MAETDGYPNASDDDWLLLRDFLPVITEHTNSKPAAKLLILDFYAETNHPYGYRYQPVIPPSGKRQPSTIKVVRDGSGPRHGIDPRFWRGSAEATRWGIHVWVDWEN